jgi:hypothetical protein
VFGTLYHTILILWIYVWLGESTKKIIIFFKNKIASAEQTLLANK